MVLRHTEDVLLKLEFWKAGPNSWVSICQVLPLALTCQIMRHGEGQRKEIYYPGHTVGRGKAHTQAILSHLQGTDMSFSFK
jgi:hypothetical protein